ncbi:MAG: pentapeptide repeat-containing protein [Pyrinomonadaceae bacterium]
MSENENFKCFCGEWRFKNAFFVIDEVREKVCRDLPCYGEVDGKEYCVLHYPKKDKFEDFNDIFLERIEEDVWDFRIVYFPQKLNYEREEFSKNADFGHAIFADGISFKYCKFGGKFVFFDSIFLEDAFFTYSHFYGQVNFNAVDFRECAYFAGVTFHEKSYPSFSGTKFKKGIFAGVEFEQPAYNRKVEFNKATFLETIDFSRTKFYLEATFKDAKFPKSGRTDFKSVNFHRSSSFENVEFFDADFGKAKFCSGKETFDKTIFKYCKFDKSVSFADTEFYQQTDFEKTSFQNAHFEYVTFAGRTNFREAQFSEDVFFNYSKFGYRNEDRISSTQVNFGGAYFGSNSRVFFDNTWFSWHTNFGYVKFDGYVLFKGTSENPVFDNVFEEHTFWSLLDFNYTTIEKPEKVYFQMVRLRPSWFVNSVFDLRKVNLIDIDWGDGHSTFSIKDELRVLEKRIKHNSKKLLTITFRQIADNAESKNRFEEASIFRRMALETEWLEKNEKISNWINNLVFENEKLKRRFSGSKKEEDEPNPPTTSFGILLKSGGFFIHGLYKITSYYGESWDRAALVLALIIFLIFPLIYTQTEFQVTPKTIPLQVVVKGCNEVAEELKSICKIESRGLKFWSEAIPHSLATATLQSVEYRVPKTPWGSVLMILEKIFAPLQAALLALAIRRKFMR